MCDVCVSVLVHVVSFYLVFLPFSAARSITVGTHHNVLCDTHKEKVLSIKRVHSSLLVINLHLDQCELSVEIKCVRSQKSDLTLPPRSS